MKNDSYEQTDEMRNEEGEKQNCINAIKRGMEDANLN